MMCQEISKVEQEGTGDLLGFKEFTRQNSPMREHRLSMRYLFQTNHTRQKRACGRDPLRALHCMIGMIIDVGGDDLEM